MSKSLRIALIVVGIAGTLSWGCTPTANPTPTSTPTPSSSPAPIKKLDEGDRPPIIIGDGSLNATIDDWATDRGTWEQSGMGTTEKDWYHKYTDPDKVTKFIFYLLNGETVSSGDKCEDLTNGVETQWLEVKAGGFNPRLQISGNGDAQLVLGDKMPRHPNVKFWLHYNGNAPMTKVTFQKAFGDDTDPRTCKFKANYPSQIRVIQKH